VPDRDVTVRAVPYGPDGVLVDLPDLGAVRALDDALRADPPPGAVDVVPAARTLLVRFADPSWAAKGVAAVTATAGALAGVGGPPAHPAPETPLVELPVRYDGPDLAEVAALTGLTEAEVVRRHAAATYTVAFGGFVPGFAYLSGLDPALHVPRRSSPRERVPAGSVAVAGELAAVYPSATPGGWRLLGTCDAPLFDVDRDPPALLTPGTRVRFVPERSPTAPVPAPPAPARAPAPVPTGAVVEVRDPGVLALVQDRGRPGLAAVGVGRSGAADARAARQANRLVGNAVDAAVLEVLLGGVELGFPAGGVLALTGAEVPAWLDGHPVAPRTATRVPPGAVLRTGHAERGLRGYVAVRGGLEVPAVLGSRSSDQLSGIGPPPVRAGDVLPVGARVDAAAQPWPDPPSPRSDPAELAVLPGPRPDWFAPGAFAALGRQVYAVTPASNRVALRLDGPPVERVNRGELPSEPLVPGAVQVPPDGKPVVFGADHPVTGGYPVLAVLTDAARDVAGQLRPGDAVRLVPRG
jgi:KipI family sensor histidine kinase inhibitor